MGMKETLFIVTINEVLLFLSERYEKAVLACQLIM